AIKRSVMRGLSIPTGVIAPSFVNGYDKAFAAYPKADAAKAKQLLAEAGYPNGFTITLNTPNDRYVNDEAIATAVAGFLGRIGNAELVSGISDLYSVRKEIAATEVSLPRYERLIDAARRLFERYHWLGAPQLKGVHETLLGIVATGDAVIDEYEKVESIRNASAKAMGEVSSRHGQ
ncbi:DNA repair ATPase, partial [Pseudomonas aeruginosa]